MAERSAVMPTPPEGWPRRLSLIYERLHGHFGYRYWWPAVDADPPAKASAFEMIVGAILVQNVSWSNTEKALRALRSAGLMEPEALLRAPAEQVGALIRPTGYFRQKTLKLKAFVEHLYGRYQGDLGALLGQPLPALRKELLSLRGIGPETCDCILCYAAGYPSMPMDAYTRRIFSRLGIFDRAISYDEMHGFFHRHVAPDPDLLGDYHAQIDTLGHRLCLKSKPVCAECPLLDLCPRLGLEVTG